MSIRSVAGILTGLMIAACSASSGTDTGASDGKADSDDSETITRTVLRNEGRLRVTMKAFSNSDLHESAEELMLNESIFGEVSLDATVVKVEERMWKEQRAVRMDDDTDLTNRDNIYVGIQWDDGEGGGPVSDLILGKRNQGQFEALEFAFDDDCDGTLLERDDGRIRLVLDGFDDAGLHASAENKMLGNKDLGSVHLDETILKVKERMFREVKAAPLEEDTDLTNGEHVYVHVEYTADDGTDAGIVMGTRKGDEFTAVDFVFDRGCAETPGQ